MSDPAGSDAALQLLRRELYWAQAGIGRARADTVSVRDRLHGYALQRRTEEAQFRPAGERALESRSSTRRALKFGLWRLLRFSFQRYDRLLAELAELNAGLAERLVAAEDEISKLRAEVDDLRQGRP
ncbi:MAG TPA: hypothetical protein VFA25_06150 [Actinomycetota bacterium]|jgi:cell division protein FtsB|nr:hypothetical protein [Actinomycetota bacterium]